MRTPPSSPVPGDAQDAVTPAPDPDLGRDLGVVPGGVCARHRGGCSCGPLVWPWDLDPWDPVYPDAEVRAGWDADFLTRLEVEGVPPEYGEPVPADERAFAEIVAAEHRRDTTVGLVEQCGAVFERWHGLLEAQVGAGDTEGLLQVVAEVTRVRSMLAAVEVRAATGFDALVRHTRQRSGVAAERVGAGIAEDLALARRDSPGRTRLFTAAARTTVADLPESLAVLRAGEANPEAVAAVAAQVGVLEPEHRAVVDAEIAGRLGGLSRRGAEGVARAMADRLDPLAGVHRRVRRVGERRVTVRPAPDQMAYLSALLPMKQAIAIKASLKAGADTILSTGTAAEDPLGLRPAAGASSWQPGRDSAEGSGPVTPGGPDTHPCRRGAVSAGAVVRSHAQIEADLFVQYLTGQATPNATPVMLNVVVTAESLTGASDRPGLVSTGGTGVGAVGPVLIGATELRAHLVEAAEHGAAHAIRAVGVDATGQPVCLSRRAQLPDRLLGLIRQRVRHDHLSATGDALAQAIADRVRAIAVIDSARERHRAITDLTTRLCPDVPSEVLTVLRELVIDLRHTVHPPPGRRVPDQRAGNDRTHSDSDGGSGSEDVLLRRCTTLADLLRGAHTPDRPTSPDRRHHLESPVEAGLAAQEVLDALSTQVVADTDTIRLGRFATGSVRELTEIRDQTCRTRYCDAPIRDIDHIHTHADGGETTPPNLQGLCKACNLTKDLPTRHHHDHKDPPPISW